MNGGDYATYIASYSNMLKANKEKSITIFFHELQKIVYFELCGRVNTYVIVD
jgi:hypothetical protein